MVYTANWVIIYHRSHLLREPETAIEVLLSVGPLGSLDKAFCWALFLGGGGIGGDALGLGEYSN